MTPQNLKNNFNNELLELAEKYCQHNDKDLNNCLYYIFKPFMEKVTNSTKEDMKEKFVEVLNDTMDEYNNTHSAFFVEEAKNKIKDL